MVLGKNIERMSRRNNSVMSEKIFYRRGNIYTIKLRIYKERNRVQIDDEETRKMREQSDRAKRNT